MLVRAELVETSYLVTLHRVHDDSDGQNRCDASGRAGKGRILLTLQADRVVIGVRAVVKPRPSRSRWRSAPGSPPGSMESGSGFSSFSLQWRRVIRRMPARIPDASMLAHRNLRHPAPRALDSPRPKPHPPCSAWATANAASPRTGGARFAARHSHLGHQKLSGVVVLVSARCADRGGGSRPRHRSPSESEAGSRRRKPRCG